MTETINALKAKAERAYPPALKEVKAKLYKVQGYSGYLLLDEPNKEGTKVPTLFYRGKWREDSVCVLAA